MQGAIDDFEDEVYKLLESDHGWTNPDFKRLKGQIDDAIFNQWLAGQSTDVVANAIGRVFAKEIA